MEAPRPDVVLGIDLGTTSTVAAAFLDDDVVVLENDVGSRLTPSCVRLFSATDSTVEERAVGKAALLQSVADPEGTIRNVKSILGRAFEDISGSGPPLGPVKVAQSDSGAGVVIQLGDVVVTPEEVASLLLANVKKCAEMQLGREVKKAVIAVPAYFNAARRQAVKDAAFVAGLQVKLLVNETSAAAVAFAGQDEPRKIVVVDIGGGGSCVSVAKCCKYRVQVLATSGRRLPGGEDFDAKMVDYCIELVKQAHGVEVRGARSREVIRSEWGELKKKLSGIPSTAATLYLPDEDLDFHWQLRRADFEEQCGPLFQAIVDQVQPTLEQAEVAVDAVDDLVLVGASSRVKLLRALLEARLGRPMCKTLNPDEAVARGAAMLGARRARLGDVRALELLIYSEGWNGTMYSNVFVPDGWRLPEQLRNVRMVRQGLGDELVTIFETKEDSNCIVYTVQIDGSGCVALEDKSNACIKLVPRGCLSDEVRQELLAKAKTRLRQDQEEERRVKAKNSLHGLCRSVLSQEQDPDGPDADAMLEFRHRCQELLQWVESHPDAPQGELDTALEETESKQSALQQRRRERQAEQEAAKQRQREMQMQQQRQREMQMHEQRQREMQMHKQRQREMQMHEQRQREMQMHEQRQREIQMHEQRQREMRMQQQPEMHMQQRQEMHMQQRQEMQMQQQQEMFMPEQYEKFMQQQQDMFMQEQQEMFKQLHQEMSMQEQEEMFQQQQQHMRTQAEMGTDMQQKQQEEGIKHKLHEMDMRTEYEMFMKQRQEMSMQRAQQETCMQHSHQGSSMQQGQGMQESRCVGGRATLGGRVKSAVMNTWRSMTTVRNPVYSGGNAASSSLPLAARANPPGTAGDQDQNKDSELPSWMLT